MSFKMAFKIFTLLFAMYLLNTDHSTAFMVSLGLGEKSQTLNWCSNRMTKLESSEPGKAWILEEVHQKWQISIDSSEPKNVEYLDVEKWLAQYCMLNIHIYRNEKILDQHLMPFAKATFNDGSEAKIFRLGDDVFQINEVIFKSHQMESAIRDLQNLLKI
jgi:hypothetical protein